MHTLHSIYFMCCTQSVSYRWQSDIVENVFFFAFVKCYLALMKIYAHFIVCGHWTFLF